MIELVEKDICTGCGACAFVCPKGCITMEEDKMGVILPQINDNICIECSKCRRACPILHPVEVNEPIKAFASRSNNVEEAQTSASGGLAAEIYKYALKEGYGVVGAVQQEDFKVNLELAFATRELTKFKNSKYVFSSAYNIYSKLSDLLKNGGKAVVAGLPCQIAAIRKLFGNDKNLFLVDIVCHGTTPHSYLKRHINAIEQSKDRKAARMSFRDPKFLTQTFTFTLYDIDDNCFYAKRTKDGDSYQYGYHRWISYRENCYHCIFACAARLGDISLADYPGLGRKIPFPYSHTNISCILANTAKGIEWINKLDNEKRIMLVERPVQEAIEGNGQLRRPTPKGKSRIIFEKQMRNQGFDFEKVMIPIMRQGLLIEKLKRISHLPHRISSKFKRIILSNK